MTTEKRIHPESSTGSIALSVEETFDVALKLHQSSNLDTAELLYRRILDVAPDHLNTLNFYGLLCHHQQRSLEAAGLIERILAIDPDNADAHNNLGNVLDGLGRLPDAEACYRNAVALNPDHAPALNNLGVVLAARKAMAEALDAYHRAVELSPDVANFRYNLGNALRKCGQVDDALAAYRKAVELDQAHVGAWQALSRTLTKAGRTDEAAGVFDEWLEKDPQNPIALYQQAACMGLDAPGRAPDAFVRKTFDEMATRFDEHLLEKLDYRAPQLLIDALSAVLPVPDASLDILDAGCGTGLCGPLLKPYARKLVGVDLSAGMLARAKGGNSYSELALAELTEFLDNMKNEYDLIVSADTLCYFGDLEPVMKAAAGALKPDGILALTLERAEPKTEKWQLTANGRYAHTDRYVRSALAAAGLTLQTMDSVFLRKEGGQPVTGHLVTVVNRKAWP
ncbi:hypothetical protein DSCA_11200 [Desulfosarcina alkanivorans]|jgi:predicted TPR repeat methyltransferase|uniref:Uncharacterized protein n=1 Tax=Desulfosarcina alkanivorans TaxID=571177 RepID=A0A5K7YGG7_9BACT|nr:tetratricopeptide repeat protein [Desulfosarcina alkanivorans]BBO67190.1 hypothetical protein DSCA_11200 [Desulfosarcina alkanivorans]